jgi:gamma-glutamylcyclotransferase
VKNSFEGERDLSLGQKLKCRRLFVYGANMNLCQIEVRCGGRPTVVGVAQLPGHKLAFYGYSKRWDGALETVDRDPAAVVWGVVYEMPFGDAEKLDTWQDARLDGAGAYFHFPAEVVMAGGETLSVVLYKKDQAEEPAKPSSEYLSFILQGAMEHGLPADYVARLSAVPSQPAHYPVPKKSRYEQLMGAGCAQCGDLRTAKGGPGFIPAIASL